MNAEFSNLMATPIPTTGPRAEFRPATRTRDQLIQSIRLARSQTDRIFNLVKNEWLDFPSIPLRHPAIFYLGHLEAFDLNLLERALDLNPARDTSWDQLFAFGVDPASASDLPAQEWPEAPQVWRYARDRRIRIDSYFQRCESRPLAMCLEHRLMHIETLIYLLHRLPYIARHVVVGLQREPSFPTSPIEMKPIPEGDCKLGSPPNDSFVWDNELPQKVVREPGFNVSLTKITNGQYLEFVRKGGPVPPFWRLRNGRFVLRGFHLELPLPLDCPVYVSQQDASAFAKWMGGSLPSECQFARYSEGAALQAAARPFVLFDCDPRGVHAETSDLSLHGIRQCFSNGWEWTRDPFRPIGPFRADPLYPGYSEPFFGDPHIVLKGASNTTPPRLIRPSFRNWFRSDYSYAYTGFRIVTGEGKEPS
jgi:iron(II)-dependent oxidoreductase